MTVAGPRQNNPRLRPPSPRRGSYRRRGASTLDVVRASGATAWYDALDGGGGAQTVPSRIGSKSLTLGSTTGVDTNDPSHTAGPPAYWLNDGTDDYLQLPTADRHDLTDGTNGAYTVMVVAFRPGATSGNYFSTGANNTGMKMLANAAGVQFFMAGTGGSVATTAQTDSLSTVGAYAFVLGGGQVFTYYHNGTSSAVSAAVSTTAITANIINLDPRVFCLAASVTGAAGIRQVYSVVIWKDTAKTQAELDPVAAYLIAAHP